MDRKRGGGNRGGAAANRSAQKVGLCLCALLLSAVVLSGCWHNAPVYESRGPRVRYLRPQGPPPKPSRVIVQKVAYFDAPRTIEHQVSPGESLSQISRTFGISPATLRRENGLRRAQRLQTGQILVLRNVKTVRYVINLYRTRPWSYIIVHHTATDSGDPCTIQRAHLQRGFCHGIGYDFVIDNGTLGQGDGVIEMTPRWLRQEDGAHCKADHMNQRGIGICLVGNFDYEYPTPCQLKSLAYLIYILHHYYDIPPSHVMGHGQVPGARTDCPGKLFPMDFLRAAARR